MMVRFLKQRFLLFLFIVASINSQSFAQQVSDTLILSLDAAIEKALANNWDVKLAQKDVRKAEEQVDEAYSNAFPRIDFVGQYMRNVLLPVLFLPPNTAFNPTPQTVTMELGSKNSYNLGVTLSQVLYSQKVNTAIKIAGEFSEFSKVGGKATNQQIKLSVKKTFYTILLARQLVKVSRQNYEAAKANFENVSALYKQGVASEYDYLRAEVQLANVQPILIQAENNLELAKSALKNILAIDINTPIDVKGEFIFEEVEREIIESGDENAVKNNPLVQQLVIQSSLLDKNITIQRSDYFPTLSLFSQYNYLTQDNSFRFKNYVWVGTFTAGLQLNYTLFEGFGRGARVQQAIIDKEKVDLNRKKLEEGLKVQVLQAKLKMDEAAKRIYAQEKSLKQADKAQKISQTRYKSGVGTQLEIIDTQAAYTLAQTSYLQAIYDYLIAKSDWEYAVSTN